jgi:hypothetical protein
MKKDFLYIAALIVISLLYFDSCSSDSFDKANQKQNDKAIKDSIQYYKNELGQEVAEKLAFKGDKDQLKRVLELKESENSQLKESLKKWKKIASATKVKTVTEIKEVPVPFKDTIAFEFERTFEKVDKFYSIFGSVNQKGINFSSISFPNTQTIVTGQKKVSFLKTEYRFEITNSNPYMKTVQADSYNFVERNKRFGFGIIGGYGLSSNLNTSFYIGVGFSYDLFKF